MCCADSGQQARLLAKSTHSSTKSSSEKLGTRSRVRSSRRPRPGSQSSAQGTSSSVTLARVPSTSTSISGLSTEHTAMRTNSCIHLAMRTSSLCRSSYICSSTPECEATCRITWHSKGSRCFNTRRTMAGNRPLCTMTSAARACAARFTIRATRSFPTRGSGKWTTSWSSMIMPSLWYAMSDLQRSSMEKWYSRRKTMWRKGGFFRRSTSSLMMPDSTKAARTLSSKDRLNKRRSANSEIRALGCCANLTKLFKV
mmetsp:Transcript_125325/g.297480  ORF Transcript_125325/g.297480 Transcript_125325/m.297480 type:complete len:255 (-) Transcript_125325:1132-1896(-)